MAQDIKCFAPWNSIYHQLNENSPCHLIRDMKYAPLQYVNSAELKNIKESFNAGLFPPACVGCSKREALGLKSTRKEILKKVGNSKLPVVDKDIEIKRLELRFSNLCNFKCRMCEPYSSSELAREMIENNEIDLADSVLYTEEKQIDELKTLSKDLTTLCLTGGEPLLIKQYYDYLDYLIDSDLSKNINVEIFTNCSVYNQKFMEKLKKFKKVSIIMSIDGVGQTAEYIRHGTKWCTVKENILKYTNSSFELYFNTAISPYTLYDIANLSYFLMELYAINKNIKTKCYSVILPKPLHVLNVPVTHKQHVLEEIDKSIKILYPNNFTIIRNELNKIKQNLIDNDMNDSDEFIKFTKKMDKRRGENFEEVFNLKLFD